MFGNPKRTLLSMMLGERPKYRMPPESAPGSGMLTISKDERAKRQKRLKTAKAARERNRR